ncbi:MAG TPA: copper chaperone PCu(A)C [Stellaceae bacterium]|nr:copper chaperone PCu(A)C [Stellaceae bacterium]
MMGPILRCMFVAALLALALPGARAEEMKNGIMVMEPWAPPSLAGAPNGAAYFMLMNHGDTADRLISLSTPVAGKAEIHREEVTNGVMRMRPTGPLLLEPGEMITLKPGTLHVMLLNLKEPLKAGEHFPLTLTFEKAGAMTLEATVTKSPVSGHVHQ